jgi:hypothetical protein
MGYQGSVRLNSRYILKTAAAILVTVILAGLYWYGASLQMTHVNTNMGEVDQSAYMRYASDLYKSGYTYIGNRNRMPVYPFLQSLFYNSTLQSETFFQQGKLRNLILSIFILTVVALIFFRNFNPLHAFNATLIVAFTVFIFKAGWFQAELLFYFLNFIMFFLMWRLLQQPSYLLAQPPPGRGKRHNIFTEVAPGSRAFSRPGFSGNRIPVYTDQQARLRHLLL